MNLVAHSLVRTSLISVRDKMMGLTAWMPRDRSQLSETEAWNVGEFDRMLYMRKRKVLSLLLYQSFYPVGVLTR